MGLEMESPAAGGSARGAGASGLRDRSKHAEAYHGAADAVEHNGGAGGQVTLLAKWRYQLAASQDASLTLVDQAVLFRLLDCLNTRTLLCKPSIEFLCEAIKRGRTVVTEAITRLKNAGWLIIRRRRGASEYAFPRMSVDGLSSSETPRRPARKSRDPGISCEPEQRTGDHLECRDPGKSDARDSGHLNTRRESENPNQGKSHPPTSLEQPSEAEQTDSCRPSDDDGFEEFWQAYPTPYGKASTRRAYADALRKHGATAGALLAAAKRYAFDRQGEPARFTKAPAGWLIDKRWEAEDTRSSVTSRPPKGLSSGVRSGSFMNNLRRLAPTIAAMGDHA